MEIEEGRIGHLLKREAGWLFSSDMISMFFGIIGSVIQLGINNIRLFR